MMDASAVRFFRTNMWNIRAIHDFRTVFALMWARYFGSFFLFDTSLEHCQSACVGTVRQILEEHFGLCFSHCDPGATRLPKANSQKQLRMVWALPTHAQLNVRQWVHSPYPPYSPDTSPCEFDCWGFSKNRTRFGHWGGFGESEPKRVFFWC